MSRTSVLTEKRIALTCELCGEAISHDVARVDGGRIYHLRCHGLAAPTEGTGMYACPKCHTLGGTREDVSGAWIECGLCFGVGYLSGGKKRILNRPLIEN